METLRKYLLEDNGIEGEARESGRSNFWIQPLPRFCFLQGLGSKLAFVSSVLTWITRMD